MDTDRTKKIHFIGSEGVSMRILKALAQKRGHQVSGSDILLSGHDAKNVDGADLVVYTSAIHDDNPEIIRAKELNIPLITRGEFLGEVCGTYGLSIAVAGAHGKTTTTAMLWEALIDLDPTVHIGGDYNGQSGRLGGNELFITEACEYKRSFLSLSPDIAVILNIDLDHTDCYKNLTEMRAAFAQFAAQAKKAVIINYDELKGLKELNGVVFDGFIPDKKILTVGLNRECDYSAIHLAVDKCGRYSFCVYRRNSLLGRIALNVAGRHNVCNALFAVAAALESGADFDRIAEGLNRFKGTKRRLELLGYKQSALNHKKNCAIFSDYAHHPKEILMSLQTIKECGYKHITVVFEPHTYTRTKSFALEFAEALGVCDQIVLLPVYAAREQSIEGGTSAAIADILRDRGSSVICFDDYMGASAYLNMNTHDEGVILFMGAGTIDSLAREFANNTEYRMTIGV